MGSRLDAAANGPALPLGAIVLMGIRFLAPSVSAALAVQGLDTSAVGVVFPVYELLVVVFGAGFLLLLLAAWPGALKWDVWLLLALVGVAGSVFAWAGAIDPKFRIVSGPWAPLPLTVAVTAAVLLFGVALDVRLHRAGVDRGTRLGFRALCAGFGLAYLLGGLRFIDYRSALGMPLPSGALWLLDYSPTFVPCFIAIYFWLVWAAHRPSTFARALQSFGPPLLGAAAGLGVSQGLGGFILSNVLAWGGAYEVFAPTAVSLSVVSFSVGTFLATAWTLHERLPGPEWRLIVGGVSVTACSGIMFFEGALASLAGILLGLTLAAYGLRLAGTSTGTQPPLDAVPI